METDFSPAEYTEIVLHKYYLSQQTGHDVGFDTAQRDWMERYSQTWRQRRHEIMLAMQREEIERHKWIESEKAQCDLGRQACLDWISKYAAQWREWFEHEYQGSRA